MSEYGDRLFEQHQKLLRESTIDPDVARERGYVSIDTKKRAADLGFGVAQQNVPALAIPMWSVRGEVEGWQLRPDAPRYASNGKQVKYESPTKQPVLLDVHPRIREKLGDPDVPLFITEGIRKADAAVSKGLTCLGLIGVYAWRGRNNQGGHVALADWEYIHLKDRRTYICFDSDVMVKSQVYGALERLTGLLRARGADVALIYLPAGEGGAKVGLDDFFACGHTVDDLLRLATPDLIHPDVDDAKPEDTFEDVPEEDGAYLLAELEVFFRRFMVFQSSAQVVAMVLWAAHTHVIDAFESTPRLALLSPEPRSGKTRGLELLNLVARRSRHVMNMTAAYLFRVVELEQPTLLIDEIDTIFGPKADRSNEDLRGLINAGHRRNAMVGRMVGEGASMVPKDFEVFAPVALAGIGKLPDTVLDRSILIALRRRAPHETIEPLRQRDGEAIGGPLHRRLAAWGKRNVDAVAAARPEMPAGIVDRAADVWEPLLAVADRAGGGWPVLARAAAVELNAARADADESIGVRLLADVRLAFSADIDRISTSDLLKHLNGLDESGWGGWNEGKGMSANELARRLKAYSIKSTDIRLPEGIRKGYLRSAFVDAWNRYPPATDATGATGATGQVSDDESSSETNATRGNGATGATGAPSTNGHVAPCCPSDPGAATGLISDVAPVAPVAPPGTTDFVRDGVVTDVYGRQSMEF